MENIQTKCCTKCGVEKPLQDFHFNKTGKFGRVAACRICVNQQKKLSGSKKRADQKYIEKHKEKLAEKGKKYRERKKNDETYQQSRKNYYLNNREHFLNYKKEWYQKNKERINLIQREYYNNNKQIIIKKGVEYTTNRRRTNDFFRMIDVIRVSIKRHIRNKTMSTETILGCSYEEFKIHIESKFEQGMNWSNHGKGNDKWNYDHIIPISSAKTIEDLYKLNHYTNFQPMWEIKNLQKSNKISEEWGNA